MHVIMSPASECYSTVIVDEYNLPALRYSVLRSLSFESFRCVMLHFRTVCHVMSSDRNSPLYTQGLLTRMGPSLCTVDLDHDALEHTTSTK